MEIVDKKRFVVPYSMPAGTIMSLPCAIPYKNDGKHLHIFVNGVLQTKGYEYEEYSDRLIRFNFDLPEGAIIEFIVVKDTDLFVEKVLVSERVVESPRVSFVSIDLTSDVPAGTNINIGSYTSGRIMVFVNGAFQTPGVNNDYQETGLTTIAFNYNLPSGTRINVAKF